MKRAHSRRSPLVIAGGARRCGPRRSGPQRRPARPTSPAHRHAAADERASTWRHPIASPARFPDGWPFPAGRAPVTARRAMVVSDAPLASSRGRRDPASAAATRWTRRSPSAFALAVVYPGGRQPRRRRLHGHPPRRRTHRRDRLPRGRAARRLARHVRRTGRQAHRRRASSARSRRACRARSPGSRRRMRRYGTLSLARVMAPAIRLASEGFRVDSALAQLDPRAIATAHRAVRRQRRCSCRTASRSRAGALLRQPALARTLRAIAARRARRRSTRGRSPRRGRRELAERGRHHHDGGPAPLPRGVARRRSAPRYRGYTLLTMPPSSSGGVTMTETLNMLEGYDPLPAFGSARWAHLARLRRSSARSSTATPSSAIRRS